MARSKTAAVAAPVSSPAVETELESLDTATEPKRTLKASPPATLPTVVRSRRRSDEKTKHVSLWLTESAYKRLKDHAYHSHQGEGLLASEAILAILPRYSQPRLLSGPGLESENLTISEPDPAA